MATAYVGVFFVSLPLTIGLEQPNWWFELLGESAFSAIMWAQIAHSVAVIVAAILPACVIALAYPAAKYRFAILVGLPLSLLIAYDIVHGSVMFGWPNSPYIIASQLIDVGKALLILILMVWIARFVARIATQ